MIVRVYLPILSGIKLLLKGPLLRTSSVALAMRKYVRIAEKHGTETVTNLSTKNIAKHAAILGLSLGSGLILGAVGVYLWWDLQIHSFNRLFRTALWLVPFLTPAIYWFYHQLVPGISAQSRQKTLLVAFLGLALSLLSATALSTHLLQRHVLRLEIPGTVSPASIQILEIKLDGKPVLMDHILHSGDWTEEDQRLVLSSGSPAWIEYPFFSGYGMEAEILITATSDPIPLTMVLDGQLRSFQTGEDEAQRKNQLLLIHKTELNPGYFKDFLPEILLLAAGFFIPLTGLMLFGISQSSSAEMASLYWKALSITGIAGTFLYAYAGFFARLFADDYCYTNYARRIGYGAAVVDFYNNWSGRFFSNLLLLGFSEQRFAPLAQILLWLAASTAGFYALFQAIPGSRRFWLALGGAFVVSFSTLSLTPDVLKSTYWIVSSVAVYPVLILFPLILCVVSWTCHKKEGGFPDWLAGLGVFVMTIALATTHEVASPSIMLLSFSGVLAALVSRVHRAKPRLFRLLLWIAAAAVVGMMVVVLAPGNYNRQQSQAYPDFPGLWKLVRMTWTFSVNFLTGILAETSKALGLAAVVIFGFSIARSLPSQTRTSNVTIERPMLAIVPLMGFALVASSFVSGAYAMSAEIPARSQIIPTYFVVLAMLLWGYFVGRLTPIRLDSRSFSAKLIILGITALLWVILVGNGITLLRYAYRVEQSLSAYAVVWDARDTAIHSAVAEGQLIQDIPIPKIESWDGPEQKYHCVRDYYRLKYP